MTWIDAFVAEIDAVLADYDREAAADLTERIRHKMNGEKARIKFGMRTYRMRVNDSYAPEPTDDDYIYDLECFRERLLEVRDERSDPMSVHYNQQFAVHNENVFNPVNNVDARASASALATATYTEACAAIEGLDLGDDEKIELHDLLADVRKSKGDETLAKAAVKSLLDKAIGLGFDALKAVLPYVWGFLLALGGAA